MSHRMFPAAELQALVPAAAAPALAARVRLLLVLIGRLLALNPALARPHHRRRQRTVPLPQLATIVPALDVLPRLVKSQQTLAPDGTTAQYQLLDEAAKYMQDPPPHDHIIIEKYVPASHPT